MTQPNDTPAKPIIKYKLFQNSGDFESWQKNNHVHVFNISPMALNVSSDSNEKIDLYVEVQIFVTYSEI